jgi:hypothetical protein
MDARIQVLTLSLSADPKTRREENKAGGLILVQHRAQTMRHQADDKQITSLGCTNGYSVQAFCVIYTVTITCFEMPLRRINVLESSTPSLLFTRPRHWASGTSMTPLSRLCATCIPSMLCQQSLGKNPAHRPIICQYVSLLIPLVRCHGLVLVVLIAPHSISSAVSSGYCL